MISPVGAFPNPEAVSSPMLARKRQGIPGQLKSLGSLNSMLDTETQKPKPKSGLSEKLVSKDSKISFTKEDLEFVRQLGAGSGGTVSLALHKPTGMLMARKILKLTATDENQEKIEKQIMRELKILKVLDNPYVIMFYGAFLKDNEISIMLEFMDLGTLDNIYAKNGPIPENYVAVICQQMLLGLIYLYDNHKIVHRDIKPSNILANSKGFVKIADFGVSKETVNTIAKTYTGTQAFLAPERIREGTPCTPASDVWSLGLVAMEIALAKFPFPAEAMRTEFDMMQYICEESSPTLPAGIFTDAFQEFCTLCLMKNVDDRPHPQQLMESSFIKNSIMSKLSLIEYFSKMVK